MLIDHHFMDTSLRPIPTKQLSTQKANQEQTKQQDQNIYQSSHQAHPYQKSKINPHNSKLTSRRLIKTILL
jgi:hypothetical protein